MAAELTEELLRLPHALAAKQARPGTDTYDELVGVGNLELVRAAANFDESRGLKPITYLHRCVELKMQQCLAGRHGARWSRLSSLDAAEEESGYQPLAIDDPSRDLTASDSAAYLLRVLSPLNRAIWRLRHERGETCERIAEITGLSLSAIRGRLFRVQGRLQRRAVTVGRRRGVGQLKPAPPPRTDRQRQAAAAFCRERAAAARMLGDVPIHGVWYVADRTERSLYGPFSTLAAALSAFGLAAPLGRPRTRAERRERGTGSRAEKAALLLAGKDMSLTRGPEAPFLVRDGYRLVGAP